MSQLSLSVRLRDEATFENYYTGSQQALVAQLQNLCVKPQQSERLLYVWGSIGRSHLLQATCWQFEQQGERSLYLPLVEVLAHGPTLLEGADQCALVCIDDIHLLAGQLQWQETIFHLFNRVRDEGRCLLLSSNCAPRDLTFELADLCSRLSQMLIFHVPNLSDENKLSALQLRAHKRGLELSDEVGRFILSRGERSMQSLFFILEQLDQQSLQAQRKLTIPFIKEVLCW